MSGIYYGTCLLCDQPYLYKIKMGYKILYVSNDFAFQTVMI